MYSSLTTMDGVARIVLRLCLNKAHLVVNANLAHTESMLPSHKAVESHEGNMDSVCAGSALTTKWAL